MNTSKTNQSDEYTRTQEFSDNLRGSEIRFASKPGISNWDTITPAVSLLAESTELTPNSRLLLIGCGHGALAVALARAVSDISVVVTDTNSLALTLTKKTLKLNDTMNVRIHTGVSVLPASTGAFDTVVMVLPKGRELVRRLLAEAREALKIGGRIYLGGANQEGVKSAIADMESLFGNTMSLGFKKGARISMSIKETATNNDIEWATKPGIAPGTWREFSAGFGESTLRIRSLPGIFSYEAIDEGTRLLIDNIDVAKGVNVLDIGCGYGVIGMVAAAKGAGRIDFVDTDMLSLAAVRENLILNGITNAEVIKSDLLSEVKNRRYGLIVSNPPFHTGTSGLNITETLVSQVYPTLAQRGKMVIVANKFLRYDRVMKEIFGNVRSLAETSKYHVLQSTKLQVS